MNPTEPSASRVVDGLDAAAWPGLALPADFDMDLFLVTAGLRDLGKWEGIGDERLPAELARLERAGLDSRAVPGPSQGESVVFFARDEATLEFAERLELAYRKTRRFEDRAPVSRELGRLLGYPACCVEAWAVGPQEDEPAIERLGATLGRPLDPRMNFFPRSFSPVGFLPCDVGCAAALAQSERVLGAMHTHLGVRRDDVVDALRGVVLWRSGPLFVLFRGVTELAADGFAYRGVVTPVDLPSFPDVPRARAAIDELRALAASFRSGSRLRVEDDGVAAYASDGTRVHLTAPALRAHLVVFGP